jgi:hypothetical protein
MSFGWFAGSSLEFRQRLLYYIENNSDISIIAGEYGLRKSSVQGRMLRVRQTFCFLQYGTSARLFAP